MMLDKSFYQQNTLKIARHLLGCILVHESEEGMTSGIIIETEAYLGVSDKAAHSYGGKHTPRMDPLYKRGGYAYIYQLHGHNYCFNVVTEKEDIPRAVLIRALEPVEGVKLMVKRRGIEISPSKQHVFTDKSFDKLKNLTNGPSKLCQAMDIDTTLNGIDLLGNELYIIMGRDLESKIVTTPRININYAEDDKDKPWRFIVKGNSFLSRGL